MFCIQFSVKDISQYQSLYFMSIYFWCFCYLYIQDSTESAQVCERGGHGIRKDLELGLFQGSPKAQPRYMHKAVDSSILSEFEEAFNILSRNVFHSRQRFSCVKNFSGCRKNSDSPILYHRHGFCCWFHSQTVLHVLTPQMYKSLVMRHISKTCFHRNYRFPPK